MRLRTCNNRRRARERRENWRAPLDRVWKRLDAAWLIDTLANGGILSMPHDEQLRADLNAYGLVAS